MTSLLFQRLLNRGHLFDNLTELFSTAVKKIEESINDPFIDLKPLPTSTEENRLFLHIPYHPRDISRKEIRNIYDSTCNSETNNSSFKNLRNYKTRTYMKIDKLTVAYSRPKNLCDLLVPSTLKESKDINVSFFT